MDVKNVDTKIVLIDGKQSAQYVINYNIEVTEVKDYIISKINSDYFEEHVEEEHV